MDSATAGDHSGSPKSDTSTGSENGKQAATQQESPTLIKREFTSYTKNLVGVPKRFVLMLEFSKYQKIREHGRSTRIMFLNLISH